MWQDKLKEIIYLLEQSSVNEIDLTFWGRRYRVVKSQNSQIVTLPQDQNLSPIKPNTIPAPMLSQETVSTAAETNDKNVLSPMPGTFYKSPSPEADPFVQVGDRVAKGDTLCIIEAMKIMNEIEAEFGGTITKILVDNNSPVEYDQPLYAIDTSA